MIMLGNHMTLKELPSLSRGQIQVLLRELRKENRIHVIGTTSAARWFSDSIPTEND